MIINHNMASLNTYNKLSANNVQTSKSLEKLSSGLRINRAGDDAAGLAISEKMRGQIRGLDQASRNAQDATSMLNTAEGNLSETQSILQRMKELATQAANDTNVGVDRNEIQKEINQLTSEVNRIGNTTEFNTQKLLNGGQESVAVDLTTAIKGADKGVVSGIASKTGVAAVAAVFDSGALTALTTGQTGSFTFNGATVNISMTGTGAAVQSSVAGNSINLVMDATTDDTAAEQATAIASALNAMKAYSGSPLADFTIASAGTNVTFTGTAANGAKYNNQVITTSGNVAIGSTTGAAQLTTAGVTGVKGQFSFSLDKPFNDGDTIVLGAETFTGESASIAGLGADEFDTDGDTTAQAKSLAAAIIASNDADLGQRYDITTAGDKIIFTEKTASAGAAPAMGAVTSTATAGVYNFTVDESNMVKDGGKYTIDGIDIKVTTDASDAGILNGTAMLVGADKYEQSANLVAAVKLNSTLSLKYDAAPGSPANQVILTQKTGQESRIAPEVSTNTKAASGFEATFQIGANTAQSMTIQINDMRSVALKISGTEAGDSVVASNGKVATLKATKDVTNGTDNTAVEYALDVSDHTKATNAISVLEDAIEAVSAERSKIGAYTNRLEHTITNLTTSSENMTSAESRIRDVDMAKEMMNFQKNNILSQAAQAMLAQANQQPQGVLQLLR